MKKTLTTLVFIAVCASLQAQTIISDFSNIEGQAFDPFNGNWNGGTPASNQFVQHAGFISIAPLNGGNPGSDGSFDAILDGSAPVDFSSITQLSLTARVDSGNQSNAVVLEVRDSSFTLIGTAIFASATFNTSFSLVQANFVLTGGGLIADATYWRLTGDGLAGSDFRMSFDNLAAVPEPTTVALIGLGLVGGLAVRRRR